MKQNIFVKAVAQAAILAALATGAQAKDWIQSFEVKPSGIDAEPVVVRATANGYTTTTATSKVFTISTAGAADMGKRINGLRVGVGDDVSVVEADFSPWSYDYTWRQIGSGERRTLALQAQFDIPLENIDWHQMNPTQACAANMAYQIDNGLTKEQVLAQVWNVSTYANFSGGMAVMRSGNVAPVASDNLGQMDWTDDETDYQVFVRCLAAPGLGNTVLPPNGTTATPLQPQEIDFENRPARQEDRPERQDTRPPRQEDRPERQDTRPPRQEDRPERQDTRPPRQD